MFVSDTIVDEEFGFPMDGSDDWLLELIESAVNDILCKTYGHEVVDDQCMIPAHRYCLYCGRREAML